MLKFTKCHILNNIALAVFSLAATLYIWWCQLRFLSIMIPKYFPESVEQIPFPFNLRCKSDSVYFVSDLKRPISVLPTLRQILFALSQLRLSCLVVNLLSYFICKVDQWIGSWVFLLKMELQIIYEVFGSYMRF